GVIEFDLDGTILTANDRYLLTMGYRLDEIQGKHHRIFVPSACTDDEADGRFWEALRRGEFQSGEVERVGKDGGGVWRQATYTPVCGPEGQPQKIVAFATDISERRRLEKQLDELRQRFAIAKGAAGVGIWEWNVRDNSVIWDEQMYGLYGISPDRFSGAY